MNILKSENTRFCIYSKWCLTNIKTHNLLNTSLWNHIKAKINLALTVHDIPITKHHVAVNRLEVVANHLEVDKTSNFSAYPKLWLVNIKIYNLFNNNLSAYLNKIKYNVKFYLFKRWVES